MRVNVVDTGSWGPAGVRRAAWLAVALVAVGLAAPVVRAEETVTVEGDTLPDNPAEFRWTVTNHSGSNIVMFKAPRFLASITLPPPGWSGEILKGTTDRNGEAVFRADSPAAGIWPGRSLSFEVHDLRRMRVGRTKRPLTVEIGRADGTQETVAGVLCPAEESFLAQNIPLIGLASMFGIFLLIQAVRKRRKKAQANAAPA
ncbi:MAG: hypothetical protein H6816_12005 [Phycisphaerales bacterium]|nr:hypothetical protein [Phycisphaerales bacterium]